jgi:hypothetical protein
MPRVLNRRLHGVPTGAVYVGRPTKWGNPFSHLDSNVPGTVKVATREEAITKYREHLAAHPCWCAPLSCHAAVLLEVANEVGLAYVWLLEEVGLVRYTADAFHATTLRNLGLPPGRSE